MFPELVLSNSVAFASLMLRKVKEIKEMTIKGLQPEVERILAEKKQDKARMEEDKRLALDEQRRELLDPQLKQGLQPTS